MIHFFRDLFITEIVHGPRPRRRALRPCRQKGLADPFQVAGRGRRGHRGQILIADGIGGLQCGQGIETGRGMQHGIDAERAGHDPELTPGKHPGGQRAADHIINAARHRDAGGQPALSRRRRRHPADHLGGRADGRQFGQTKAQPGGGQRLGGECLAPGIGQPGAAGIGRISGNVAAQAQTQKILAPEHMPRAGQRFRFIQAQPAQYGQALAGPDLLLDLLFKDGHDPVSAPGLDHGGRSGIRGSDAGPHDLSLAVHKETAGPETARGDGRHIPRPRAGRLQRPLDGRARRAPHGLRITLGVPGPGIGDGIGITDAGELITGEIEDCRLGHRAAGIDRDQTFAHKIFAVVPARHGRRNHFVHGLPAPLINPGLPVIVLCAMADFSAKPDTPPCRRVIREAR